MANISSRASTLAIKKEITEGTPVHPTAGTDFVALQDDYALEAAFDTLENAELAGSIGAAKPTLGAENPTLTTSHYLKGSGTEGVEPDYGELMEGIFGSKSVAGTEEDTVAGSTTSVLNVDAGEGVNYFRGRAVLVKNSTYEIRNVLSVATDALTLGHVLDAAPAAGVDLGKAVTYIPGNTHPSYTFHEYEGNGGLIQMIAGGKVASSSVTIDPEEFINASFNIEGVSYYFNPIRIQATDAYIDFNDGGVKVATVAVQTYKSPGVLAQAIQDAMNSVSSGITVTYSSSTGKFTIAKASGTLSLLWNTGANTANTIGDVLGFSTAADDTAALTYTADNAQNYAAPFTPSYDSVNPIVGKNAEVYLGSATETACFGVQNFTWSMENTLVNIPDVCEESGRSGKQATQRAVTFEIVATARQYDVTKYESFKDGDSVRFVFNAGEKSGVNWVPGKCINIFSPTAVISSFAVDKADDLTIFNMTVTCFVENGLGEIYFNTL